MLPFSAVPPGCRRACPSVGVLRLCFLPESIMEWAVLEQVLSGHRGCVTIDSSQCIKSQTSAHRLSLNSGALVLFVSISPWTRLKLISAFILSKLDYCNSLLAGSPQYLLDKLRKVQNSSARLVLKGRKRDHVQPLPRKLHWLPIRSRIEYKTFLSLLQLFH